MYFASPDDDMADLECNDIYSQPASDRCSFAQVSFVEN